jgi:hypothetical protein
MEENSMKRKSRVPTYLYGCLLEKKLNKKQYYWGGGEMRLYFSSLIFCV